MDQTQPVPPVFFWDGRALTLEEQVLQPLFDTAEMGSAPTALLHTLSDVAGYPPYFAEAFGSPDVSLERVAAALADYVRSRTSGGSAFDQWRIDRDQDAVSGLAKLGYDLFSFKAGCVQCHSGSNFTDGRFHNIGIGWNEGEKAFADEGRFGVTRSAADLGTFKTPGLRDVSRRAPYMHDGSMATLRDVILHYNRGGNPNRGQSLRIRPLGLSTREMAALEAFLRSLDGMGYQDRPPRSFPQ